MKLNLFLVFCLYLTFFFILLMDDVGNQGATWAGIHLSKQGRIWPIPRIASNAVVARWRSDFCGEPA